mgnify:CR=1 FL=1
MEGAESYGAHTGGQDSGSGARRGSLAFASGMAAATTAVLTACKAGSHVVCLHNAYGPLKDFLSKYCTEHLDITLTYVTGDRVEEFEEAVTDATDLIVLESPSSVLFSLQTYGPCPALPGNTRRWYT